MDIEWQIILNIMAGAMILGAGEMMRRSWGDIKRLDERMSLAEKLNEERSVALHIKIESAAKELRVDHSNCWRTMPTTYVPRVEHDRVYALFHDEFRSIHTKLDALQKEKVDKN